MAPKTTSHQGIIMTIRVTSNNSQPALSNLLNISHPRRLNGLLKGHNVITIKNMEELERYYDQPVIFTFFKAAKGFCWRKIWKQDQRLLEGSLNKYGFCYTLPSNGVDYRRPINFLKENLVSGEMIIQIFLNSPCPDLKAT